MQIWNTFLKLGAIYSDSNAYDNSRAPSQDSSSCISSWIHGLEPDSLQPLLNLSMWKLFIKQLLNIVQTQKHPDLSSTFQEMNNMCKGTYSIYAECKHEERTWDSFCSNVFRDEAWNCPRRPTQRRVLRGRCPACFKYSDELKLPGARYREADILLRYREAMKAQEKGTD